MSDEIEKRLQEIERQLGVPTGGPFQFITDESIARLIATVREQMARADDLQAELQHNFIGPCAHGRDPYDRCEEGCAELWPVFAELGALEVRAEAAEKSCAAMRVALEKALAAFIEAFHDFEHLAGGGTSGWARKAMAKLDPAFSSVQDALAADAGQVGGDK